jgi:hypothetical protein
MIRSTTLATVLALLAGVSSLAMCQSRTPVSVEVRLEAKRFRTHFDSQLSDVEQRAAKQFTRLLAREIGFLRFAVHDTASRYRLLFLLDLQQRGSTSRFTEFGFWVRLERPDDVRLERYWLPFRSAQQASAGVGSAEAFLGELAVKLAHADLGALSDSLLKKIPITEQALIVNQPLGWAIALPRLDLCMKTMSQLELLSDFRIGDMSLAKAARARVVGDFQTSVPPPLDIQQFLGGAFSEPAAQPVADELTRLLRDGQVTVKEVYVTSYIHDPNACRDRGAEERP